MKMTATKRFHASDIQGPEGRRTVNPGEEFEAPDTTGAQLLEKGLATEASGSTPSATSAERNAVVGSATDAGEKQEPGLLNKMEPTPKKKDRTKQSLAGSKPASEPDESEE